MDDAGDRSMKHSPRFAISSGALEAGVARLGGKELHHLRDVMRLGAGARVSLIDERGIGYAGVVRCFERSHAVIEIAGTREPAAERRPITLGAAIIKGARMDFLIEKAAELVAAELRPVLTAHGVARSSGAERVSRWRRLATAAAKQSLAAYPMVVGQPVAFADLIRVVSGDTLGVICGIGGEPLGPLIRRMKPDRILLAVGPEGDFDAAEQDAAMQMGFVRAGLGQTRLRSETAALAALSIAIAAIEEISRA
jgi:16S rRNA (uracil1498-N3)-methyltransferase